MKGQNERLERLKKMRIGILMGGTSAEREVSLKTGKAILQALKRKGLEALPIDVGKDVARRILKEKIDLAFIALHGRGGEDGTVQGLLELLGIPYTGSGVLASALALNKVQAKKVFRFHGLPVPKFQVFKKRDPGSRIQDLGSLGILLVRYARAEIILLKIENCQK